METDDDGWISPPKGGRILPLNKRTPEERFKIQSKGGSSTSPKKSLARKLDHWKRLKKINKEQYDELYDMLTDPDINALHVRTFIETIKPVARSATEKTNLANILIHWHKAHFGEKIKSENLNLNVNVGLEEWERRLSKKFHGTNNEE
jgi:hypothetical protein